MRTTSATSVADRPDTASRILDSAFRSITDVGLGRTTVEDVARIAGLSRQTIYRYYPSKDHLVTALVLREEEKFLDGIRAAFATNAELDEAIYHSILFCLRFAREHPLLDRLLDTDPETLLPYLTTRGAPVLLRARQTLIDLVTSKAWVRADVLQGAADAAVRVVISYALTPPERHPEDVARDLARILALALTGKQAKHR